MLYFLYLLLLNLNSMAKSKITQSAKLLGVLTFVSAMVTELLPLVQKENPKLKKKISHIISLLSDLKDEVLDVAGEIKKIGGKKKGKKK